MSKESSLIEKIEKKSFLVRIKETILKRKKEEKFQELLKQTTAKLVNDIRVSGYVREEYEENGKRWRAFYWVALKGAGDRRYSILINAESDSLLARLYPNPEGKVVDFDLFAGDMGFINGARRTFILGASRLKPDESFFIGEGASLLSIYKILDQPEHSRKRMSDKEQEDFMEELRTAVVDVERTQAAFESAKGNSSNGTVYWFRDKPTNMLSLR